MRRIYITCILSCFISLCHSITIEEIEKLIAKKSDSVKVEILDSIAWENRSNNVDLAFYAIQKSLAISKKFKSKKQYAKGLITLSKVYGNKKQFDLSIRIAKESIEQSRRYTNYWYKIVNYCATIVS